MIFKCQDLIVIEGFDMHALRLATSVTAGKVSEDSVAMGIIEGATMKLEDQNPRKCNNPRGSVSKCEDLIKTSSPMHSSRFGFVALQFSVEKTCLVI